jgi:hypothetical protein
MTKNTSISQLCIPKTYMALSIISLMFGVGFIIPLILSIIALVHSNKVSTAYFSQRYEEASKASKMAKKLSIISLIWTSIVRILFIVFMVLYYVLVVLLYFIILALGASAPETIAY